MTYQSCFERKEIKYLLTPAQYAAVAEAVEENCEWDKFPTSTVTSLYYDTPTNLLIRRSIEAPAYKEKLRVRVYGKANADSTAYVELKKKYEGVVYKRRTGLPVPDAAAWLRGEIQNRPGRIEEEIEQFLRFYGDLAPAMLIACERDSFLSERDCNFRVTFDRGIRFRTVDLSLLSGSYGEMLLHPGYVLMEAKAPGMLPGWFIKALSENCVRKTSFSKYGTAYKKRLTQTMLGGKKYA